MAPIAISTAAARQQQLQQYTWAVGRRKTAIARVRLAPGTGNWTINGKPVEDYFSIESHRTTIQQPLKLTETAGKFDVFVNVTGGGPHGQADAVRHGVARALNKVDVALRPKLKSAGFLTRDPRMRERKKAGQPGARKRFQFSKR
jgi:small subunit ribosomal protein S9